MTTTQEGLRELRRSHEALAARLRSASDEDLARISGSSEWTVAQVASHLGSQAEIFEKFLDAGLGRGQPPSQEEFPPIWDKWNARTPRSQAEESVAANEGLLSRIESLDDAQLGEWRVAAFGMEIDADRLIQMRLSEHSLHSWDVDVAFDPAATVAPGSVSLLIDTLGGLASRTGHPAEVPYVVALTTTAPERRFVLDTAGVSLDPVAGDPPPATRSVGLPSEALVRLIYGRISDAHPAQGAVVAEGVSLAELARVFGPF